MNLGLKRISMCIVIFGFFSMLTPGLENEAKPQKEEVGAQAGGIVDTLAPVSAYNSSFISNNEVPKQEEKKEVILAAADISKPEKYGFNYTLQGQNVNRDGINLGNGMAYSDLEGVTCFRGNNMRDGGSFGTAQIVEGKLQKDWEVKIGSIDSWSGVGWNGQ
ncbi:MAG: hypothetical protein Q8930_08385, partial [Bacillota bacterium]|nr:hypothetical protein [Bacillota bacterium]